MGKYYLYSLFEPQSTAVAGTGDCIDSVGLVVIEPLSFSAFPGKIYPVTPTARPFMVKRRALPLPLLTMLSIWQLSPPRPCRALHPSKIAVDMISSLSLNSLGLMRPLFGLNTPFNKNSTTKSILLSSKD